MSIEHDGCSIYGDCDACDFERVVESALLPGRSLEQVASSLEVQENIDVDGPKLINGSRTFYNIACRRGNGEQQCGDTSIFDSETHATS